MNHLIEEAVILELFGIRMYAFGAYVALGTLFAVIVLAMAGRTLSLKKGTVPLTACLTILCAFLGARVAFCLLNRELGHSTPLFFWPQVNGGGWSMFGLIGGVWLGGYISAKVMKEKPYCLSKGKYHLKKAYMINTKIMVKNKLQMHYSIMVH